MNMIDDALRVGEPKLTDIMPAIVALRNVGVKLSAVIINEERGNTRYNVDDFIEKLKKLRIRHGGSTNKKVAWFVYGLHKQLLSRMKDQEPYYITRKQIAYLWHLLLH